MRRIFAHGVPPHVPRRESRYPFASFCSRKDAASIVRKRLFEISVSVHRGLAVECVFVPFLDFIIPVVCLFDVTCRIGLLADGAIVR